MGFQVGEDDAFKDFRKDRRKYNWPVIVETGDVG